ncbi:hypothetical protein GPJ81_15115 [Pseudomonas alkylphenolica]|uniref:Uncharacterized protein n=1 Tax=Pseudomonas alkylphenolica TaxID=237609 RepID=A0A6I6GTX1_9PSED|nr:hypothetical protein [Pseudomonas alkylphenolica]QGW77963.1 hypothetical protein GPJ81_15115 [Pseudomonas alkylphenolica]
MNSKVLVGYLEASNPTALGFLRNKFPESKQMLSGAMDFGGDNKNPTKTEPPNRTASFELIKETVEQLIKDIDSLVLVMKSSMLLVRRIRLSSSVVAAATGVISAALAFMAQGTPLASDKVAVGVAAVTALSGFLGVFAEHFERTPIGVKFGGVEELTSLVNMRADVERISIRTRHDDLNPCSEEEIKQSLGLVTDITLKVLRLKYLSPS